ncbi:MAG: hypothetical protein Q8P48_08120 [Deltaproteobacteria bacterium]|nr:hypothetical protein [Deltaproteobacteria bacterium]
MPFFARRIGRDCTYCHTLIPKLNETGRIFRSNGYRFIAEEDWQDVRDWQTIPVSVEVEVEGMYDRLKASGVVTETSDMKVEEVEIAAGGPMGRSGRVSALALAAFEETDSGVEASISRAFVQVNDLVGPPGEGRLNIRAGKWDVGLPFLNTTGVPISNRYLADRTLNVLTAGQRAVELNGSLVKEGEDSSFAQRYSAGLSREEVFDDDKLKGFYATYSFTVNEIYSLGGIYRTGREGREKLGSVDTSYNKYGVAGEVEAGPVVLTAGFFISDRNGAARRDDYIVEAFFIPYKSLGFGARYDYLKEHGKEGVKSQSFMVRYGILSNVYAQIEYRGLEDDAHVAGGVNESERRLRAFLFAIF